MVRIVVVSLAALLAAACKPAAHGKVSGRIPAADAPAEPAEPASARATAPASSLVSASGVDVSAPMDLHGCIDQALDLVHMRDIGRESKCLAATAGQFVCECLDAIGAPSSQHHNCTLGGEMPGRRLAQSTARSRDDNHFSFNVLTHESAPHFLTRGIVCR